jgi:hypothetical protein
MGSPSIWHWLIVLALALIVVPIALASQQKMLGRKAYALRTGPLFVAGALVSLFNSLQLLLAIITLVGSVFVILWSVHRTQDIGWSRWLNLLFLVPLGGIVWWIVLMAAPSRARGEAANKQA